MEKKDISEWKSYILPALESKQSEFSLMGYAEITINEIWECLKEKVWKNNEAKRLHEVVQDVFHLQISVFMSFMTVQAFQDDDDLMTSINALMEPNNK